MAAQFGGVDAAALAALSGEEGDHVGCRSAFPTSVSPVNTSVDGWHERGDGARCGHQHR
jgi:hypothetical protein